MSITLYYKPAAIQRKKLSKSRSQSSLLKRKCKRCPGKRVGRAADLKSEKIEVFEEKLEKEEKQEKRKLQVIEEQLANKMKLEKNEKIQNSEECWVDIQGIKFSYAQKTYF